MEPDITKIVISRALYKTLLDAKNQLDALEWCGVDNWEGYGEAMRRCYGDEEEHDINMPIIEDKYFKNAP